MREKYEKSFAARRFVEYNPASCNTTSSTPEFNLLSLIISGKHGWSRGEVWSSRWPVKPEVAGSNPVGTAVG